jgi:hypothetical protein
MPARRFLPPGKTAAAETKASHEVMDLVRKNPELSFLVVQLHELGRSWPDVESCGRGQDEAGKEIILGRCSALARHRLR